MVNIYHSIVLFEAPPERALHNVPNGTQEEPPTTLYENKHKQNIPALSLKIAHIT